MLVLKSDQWEHELCVYALCMCMPVVKADVIFNRNKALANGKTGRIACSALLPSLL